MDRERFELKVGIFVFVGILMLGLIVVVLGAKQDLFSSQYRLYAEFEEVSGLKVGAPVRLSGVDVGTVDEIKFPDTKGEKKLKVRLQIRSEVRDRIRDDSKAEIATQGVLGDKYIGISLGTDGAPLAPGTVMASTPPTNFAGIIETAGKTMEHIESITGKVDAMVNPGTGEEAKKGIQNTFSSVAAILHEVETGTGLLHKLIYDKESGKLVDNVKEASANVAALTNDARNGKGVIPALLNDPKPKATLDHLAATAANLEKTTAQLNDVIGRIDRGEGTVGSLINDPGVYDDIRALLGRAKRNRILRTVIRHQIDKNENLPKATPVPSETPATP